jgi:hypothetical protein
MIKSRRMKSGLVTRLEEARNSFKILVGKPVGKRSFGKARRRWEDNIELGLRELG